MYAIIETGGQQFRVQEGDLLKVEKLDGEVGHKVEIDKVLMIRSEDDIKVGAPYVDGAKVVGEIVEQDRAKKVTVFKFRRRLDSHVKRGHRQHYTALKISQIVG
ncbi:MAG: 50S ribosomal protein L21 [Candidatus Lernaella stagnicola]|nr:50S ribosomal protein L21 [Candidatus Lernaella stagnicola]